MEDKPTVQMDSYPPEDQGIRSDQAKTPATIPIDDMLHQQGWPATPPPPQYSAPPPPPAQQPPTSPPPFSAPPSGPAPAAGATKMMGRPAAPSLLAWLAVVEGPGAARAHVFALQRETVIGRTAGQVLLSGDAFASGQHAKIRLEPSEEDEEKEVLTLYDLASANGTFAGSRDEYRDSQVYRHELQDGDFILIGETTLVFKAV